MNTLRELHESWEALSQPRKIKRLRIVAIACYIVALFLFVIYAFGGTSKRTSSPAPVVLFMESMPGSMMALRYLAKRRDVSILMIVLVANSWNVNINAAYDNTAAFILKLRKEGILNYDVPIYYGNSVSMCNERFFNEISFAANAPNTTACTYRRVLSADLLFDADRLFGAADSLEDTEMSAPLIFFEEPLDELLTHSDAHFLVLGPATDAALFLKRRPERRGRVASLFLAGGVISANGNARLFFPPNRNAELRMFLDPLAANYLLRGLHGRPVVLIPNDAAPQWPTAMYEKLIGSRLAESNDDRTENIVARAVSGINTKIPSPDVQRLPLEVTAAAYFSDYNVRHGAVVSDVALAVANGDSMARDGTLGTADGDFKVKVILQLQNKSFWSRFEVLDNLSLLH